MKKLLLATLVSTASIGAAYADGPTVYGKINASVDDVKSDLNTKSVVAVDSNASRFGIKGDEKLTDNLSAIYGIEWGVVIDNNSTNSTADGGLNTTGRQASNGGSTTTELSARNRFIGLQYTDIGALKIGRLDSYVKTAQYVNPSQGVDIADDLVNGNLDSTQTFAGENRLSNVIAVETAKFNTGFGTLQGNLLVSPSEKTIAEGSKGSTGANGVSGSIVYANKDIGVYSAIAFDQNVASYWNAVNTINTTTTAGAAALKTLTTDGFVAKTDSGSSSPTTYGYQAVTDIVRWVGSVDLSKAGVQGLTLNALVQQATLGDTSQIDPKETSYLVSAIYKFPASILDGLSAKLQWQNATTKDLSPTASDVKISQVSADVDYAFSPKTRVYGYYAVRDLKNPNNPTVAANGVDQDYSYASFGLGIEQKF